MLLDDPFTQFKNWMDDAVIAGVAEPTAMLLATTGLNMQPSARVVLLKYFSNEGFCFFTNYESIKGQQISENHLVAATFHWKELERQVRIEGTAGKLPREVSEEYFKSRPYGSRLSAVASPQSQPIVSRNFLLKKIDELKSEFNENTLQCPKNWGGYIIKPHQIEFWQGRENRLHDRIMFSLHNGIWDKKRLSP